MNKNNNTKYRLEQVEKSVDKLDGKMDQVLENHLPHLSNDIASLKAKVVVLGAVNIAAIVISKLL